MKNRTKNIPLFILALAALAVAQQPQTQTAPIYSVNAKYVNGVAPGYAPTKGTGLTLNLGGGTANCGGTIVTYAAGTLTMTGSATNYVYLNTAASCAPAVKTTAFTSSDIPIATVTAGSSITAIADDRTMFQQPGSTGSSAVNVNGAAVSSPNLNDSTPSAGSGYVNGKWQKDGSGNVSVEIPLSTATGLGYPAIPAVMFAGDSLNVVSTGATNTCTAVTMNGTTITVTCSGTLPVVGQDVQFQGNASAWSPSCLTWMHGHVLTSGGGTITISQSEAQVPTYNGCTGSNAGTGGTLQDMTVAYPNQTIAMMTQISGAAAPPWINLGIPGDTIEAMNTNYTARYHSYLVAHPGTFVVIQVGLNSLNALCDSAAVMEAAYQTLWTSLKADGAIIVQQTIPGGRNQGGGTCTGAPAVTDAVIAWLQAQKTSTSAHPDYISDVATKMSDNSDNANQYFIQKSTDPNPHHYTRVGAWIAADDVNLAMLLGSTFAGRIPSIFSNAFGGQNDFAGGMSSNGLLIGTTGYPFSYSGTTRFFSWGVDGTTGNPYFSYVQGACVGFANTAGGGILPFQVPTQCLSIGPTSNYLAISGPLGSAVGTGGLQLQYLLPYTRTSNPSSFDGDGQIWYRSDLHQWCYNNNGTASCGWGGGSGVSSIAASAPIVASGSTGAVTISCPTCTSSGIADIQITVGTTAIAANSCLPTNTTFNTATMTGLATTSAIDPPTPSTNYASVTGWSSANPALYFNYYPTANTLNWQVCNSSSSSVMPGSSTTWNVGAR